MAANIVTFALSFLVSLASVCQLKLAYNQCSFSMCKFFRKSPPQPFGLRSKGKDTYKWWPSKVLVIRSSLEKRAYPGERPSRSRFTLAVAFTKRKRRDQTQAFFVQLVFLAGATASYAIGSYGLICYGLMCYRGSKKGGCR